MVRKIFMHQSPTRLQSSYAVESASISESAEESQRTVFVMNCNDLSATLLSEWEFEQKKFSDEMWPWELSIWEKDH